MLKITAPFREREEVIPLIEAGADELYCGYLSPEWARRYTTLEFERKGGGSNFTDLAKLKQALELAHTKRIPVYLTLNGLYVNSQYPILLQILERLNKTDIDGYIVADIGLLLTLRKLGCNKEIHISTGGTVFNSEAVCFYRDLGASRIVLDRQVSLDAINLLSRDNPDIDFEVFILNTLCVYIDGFCTFMHTSARDRLEHISARHWHKDEKVQVVTSYDPHGEGDACCLKYSVQVYGGALRKRIYSDKVHPNIYKHLTDGCECAACAIFDIAKAKVKSIKIVGRQLNSPKRLKDVRFIRSVLDILMQQTDISREDFISQAQKLYRQAYNYDKQCRGNNCYHPALIVNR